MFYEGCDLPPERRGVLLAQIDLVLCAAQPESHRLISRASIKIVFQCDGDLLCHPGLPWLRSGISPYKINCQDAVTAHRQLPATSVVAVAQRQSARARRGIAGIGGTGPARIF